MKNVIKTISKKLYLFSKKRRFLNDKADVIFMFSNENLLKKLDRLHHIGLKISKKVQTSIQENDLLKSCNISNLRNCSS